MLTLEAGCNWDAVIDHSDSLGQLLELEPSPSSSEPLGPTTQVVSALLPTDMVELPDIEALSQEIAKLHLQGDLIPDERVRRVTLAQLQNAPDMGPPHHRLLIGGRECKYIEVVANVPDIVHCKTGIRFTLDDGFGRLDAWLPRKPALDNPKQKATIASLRPFDYAHIEGRVHRPPEHSGPIFQIISLRRVNSPYEIYLHLLQTLAEIDETVAVWNEKEVPESASALLAKSPAEASSRKRAKSKLPGYEPQPPMMLEPVVEPQPRATIGGKHRDRKGKARAQSTPSPDEIPRPGRPSIPPETPQKLLSPPGKHSPAKTPAALRTHPMYLGKRILRYFRSNYALATSREGITVNDKRFADYLKEEQGIDTDISTDELREAMESLLEQNYIYKVSQADEFHYGLVTQ